MAFIQPNIEVYRAIATEALQASVEAFERHLSPRPGGGSVIRFDPSRASFKNSLIAIAFAGIYLEALLHLSGVRKLGLRAWQKVDRLPYEAKLEALGIGTDTLLADCRRFRDARNDLLHDKALDTGDPVFRVAQDEAAHAVRFVVAVSAVLLPPSVDVAGSDG